MSEELLNTLEEKVLNAVEMIEFLKVEVADLEPLKGQLAELTEENNALKEARSQWEEKLTSMIGKLEQQEDATESDASEEDADDDESEEDSEEGSDSGEHSFST